MFANQLSIYLVINSLEFIQALKQQLLEKRKC